MESSAFDARSRTGARPLGLIRAWGLLLWLILVGCCGCSTSDHPAPVPGSYDPPPLFGPSTGADCEEEGAVRGCGHVTRTYGDYVTCSMGEMTCHDGKWGACVGDRLVTMSQPNVRLTRAGLRVS